MIEEIMPPLTTGQGKPKMRRKEERPSHLTYMIAETLIPASELDVTKLRGYGIGDRDPSTLPGRKIGSESEWDNHSRTRYWESRRKWVQSANSTGVKAYV